MTQVSQPALLRMQQAACSSRAAAPPPPLHAPRCHAAAAAYCSLLPQRRGGGAAAARRRGGTVVVDRSYGCIRRPSHTQPHTSTASALDLHACVQRTARSAEVVIKGLPPVIITAQR
eukprot:COSAG01_NODE_333_length_18717_cov_40.372072_8_plen_117_part_00